MVTSRWRRAACRPPKQVLVPLAGALLLALSALPSRAASNLFAWRINREGQLELRTSPDTLVRAFFQEGRRGQGPRVWFDLPGAPMRPRTLRGAGPLEAPPRAAPFGGRSGRPGV